MPLPGLGLSPGCASIPAQGAAQGPRGKDTHTRTLSWLWRGCPVSGPPRTVLTIPVSLSTGRHLPRLHVHHCRLPRTVFGNGRTHTGEVMGSGGSRLANYGVRAPRATAASHRWKGHAMLGLPPREGGTSSYPQAAGQWQRVGAAGSDTRLFPCTPLRSQVSKSAERPFSSPQGCYQEGLSPAMGGGERGRIAGGGNIWGASALTQLFPWVMNLLTYLRRPRSGWALRPGRRVSFPPIHHWEQASRWDTGRRMWIEGGLTSLHLVILLRQWGNGATKAPEV